MKTMLVLCTALATTSALAQSDAPPLDLQVPASHAAPVGAVDGVVAAGGADSPGAYYGDTSGAVGAVTEEAERDQDAAAGRQIAGAHVSGAFSTGVGYSKGLGTGFSNAAELNVEKQTDDGKTFGLHIDVERTTGFPGARGLRYRDGGY